MKMDKRIDLSSTDKNIISRGEWLTDVHMEHFGSLLERCSDYYKHIETWRIQCLDTIEPVATDKKHIQILHSSSGLCDGHWVCCYYDTRNIFIYDSLNQKKLHKHHEQFLRRLFPTYRFDKKPVKFPVVQNQPNGSDCGVFAIAFAISLLFRIKPENVKYNHTLMRSHLTKIFESNIIEHFPQDIKFAPQKVLPLALIKVKDAEALRQRMIRKCKINRAKIPQNEKSQTNKLELIRAKKRKRYQQNIEDNRARKRKRYEQNCVN